MTGVQTCALPIYRGRFPWALAEQRNVPGTRQAAVFRALRELAQIRAAHDVFCADAEVVPFDTGSDQVLGVRRIFGDRELVALFNFCEEGRWIFNPGRGGVNLVTGAVWGDEWIELQGYEFIWLDLRRGDGHDQ